MATKTIWGAVFILLLTAANGDTQRYRLDAATSEVSARVAFLAIASKTAGFPKISGSAELTRRDPETLNLDVRIDARALTAPDRVTLRRLKSERFFWVEKFPEIRFRGTGLRMRDERHGSLQGELTARGVTRPVSLAVAFARAPSSSPATDPIDITGTTEIDRREFGMTSYALIVGKKVEITIRARMVPQ